MCGPEHGAQSGHLPKLLDNTKYICYYIYTVNNDCNIKEGHKMAQSLKSKIRKLSDQFNIDSIVETAVEVRNELIDEQVWNNMTAQQKTDWFYDQCAKYNLTTRQRGNHIIVNELPEIGKHDGTRAYFTVFLPDEDAVRGTGHDAWHLEIGGAYISNNNGGIWTTSHGLKGKEKQIAEVMRLHNLGE